MHKDLRGLRGQDHFFFFLDFIHLKKKELCMKLILNFNVKINERNVFNLIMVNSRTNNL